MTVASEDNLEVSCERVYLRREPSAQASIDTELFFGTPVDLLEKEGGWVRIRSGFDGYEGYVEEASLAPLPNPLPNPLPDLLPDTLPSPFSPPLVSVEKHSTQASVVVVPLALGYKEPKDTSVATFAFPMGSRLRVSERAKEKKAGEEGSFVVLRLKSRKAGESEEEVFVKRHQILPFSDCGIVNGRDWISTALKFLNVPYLYGGGCYAGIDCSALLQVSMGVHGIVCPRDSAPQERSLGKKLDWTGRGGKEPLPALLRGDLVFWHRHVGVMVDGNDLLHANAGAMAVSRESLAGARIRIMEIEGEIRCIKRLKQNS